MRPTPGQVLVFVEEDHVSKPVGSLRRPALRGQTIWFRQDGRYLGFIVYAGRGVSAKTRVATQRLLDSLQVR